MYFRYYGYELRAQLVPRWHRIETGSFETKRDCVFFRLASETVNVSEWPDPPHVFLANLGYVRGSEYQPPSEEQLRLFFTRYGPLGFGIGVGDVSTAKTEEANAPEGAMYWLESFYSVQKGLRRAWEAGDPQLFTAEDIHYWALGLKEQRGRLVIEAKSCLDYMHLLLARDISAGLAKRCANRGCANAPYFIAKRNDQLYCSHPCASTMGVKRYRAAKKEKRLKKRKTRRSKR
jgi:hypothetical protein